MPSELAIPVCLVHRRCGRGATLTEPLFFAEISRLASTVDAGKEMALRALIDLIPRLEPDELIRRVRAVKARRHAFSLAIDPPRASEAWRSQVTLRFHAIVWEQAGGFVLARVPVLGIEVIATAKDDLDAILQSETLAALRRKKLTTSLMPLAWAQTSRHAKIEWTPAVVKIPSLKERALADDRDDESSKKSVLHTVASQLRSANVDRAFEVEEIVSQIAEALTAKPPQSVLLVGPSGVGKTAALHELVSCAEQYHLGQAPFYRTSGARIVAGQTGFGMWEQRCQQLIKDASKKQAILHVGNLIELMDVGKSEGNPTGIATFLRPAIARGELFCVAECTPEQVPLIEKEDPQLLDAFRRITMEEPNPEPGRIILAKYAAEDRRREPTSAALAAIDRLHRRYATYSAYPGRPLRFLDNLRRDGARGTALTETEIYASFARETGMPRALIDPNELLDLDKTRQWFAARVVGQPEAVELVVQLLATVKAGLARPNRPVASLLFVGPTGVGKTEMAKALAEFLFGAANRLTRFDMSEYADPIAVRRLVGGAFGKEGLLTAAIREQPFCVLLLDEVEKADRSAFDLLLQALGEARLTDAGGRLADLRNAVIIMTSNLGAESFRSGRPGFGAHSPQHGIDAAAHFGAAVEKFLRPEMVNRLDRIVPFAPLGAEVIRSIADREWEKVLLRDGVRFRGMSVTTSNNLLEHLATIGFDVKYGARPLKRAMERELLAPLAKQINRHTGDVPLTVDIGVAMGRPTVAVRPLQGPRAKAVGEASSPIGQMAVAAQDLRRWHQLLERSSIVREIENDIYQLTTVEKLVQRRQLRNKPLRASDGEALARLGRLRELHGDLLRCRIGVFELEEEALIRFYTSEDGDLTDLGKRQTALNQEWDDLLYRLYAVNRSGADRVTLIVTSEHRGHMVELTEAYRVAAERQRLKCQMAAYLLLPGAEAKAALAKGRPTFPEGVDPATEWLQNVLFEKNGSDIRAVLRRQYLDAGPIHDHLPEIAVATALMVTGPAADVRFSAEGGLHEFLGSASEDCNPDVRVSVTSELLVEHRPPVDIVRKGSIKAESPRRSIDRAKGTVHDRFLEEEFTNTWGELTTVLAPILDATVRYRLRQVVLE